MAKKNNPVEETVVEEAAKTESGAQGKEAEKAEKKKKSSSKNAELDALKKQLDDMAADLAAAKEAHMRTLAEYDNYRKRTTKEKEAAYGDAKAAAIKALLPVLDNIDRADAISESDVQAYKQGVNMIFSGLTESLKKLGLESFGEKGDEFDPNIHNAVMHTEDENEKENVIGDVFEKGYKIGDRILRPAMVRVVN